MIRMSQIVKYLILAVFIVPGAAWSSLSFAAQPNPMHPAFKLLDDRGEVILHAGEEPDQVRTCGQCHSTDFIDRHHLLGHISEQSSMQASSGDASIKAGSPASPACLSCHYEGGKPDWNSAFDSNGMVKREWLRISKPSVSNCGSCHGLTDSAGSPVSIPGDYLTDAYPMGGREPERFQLTRSSGSIYSSQEVAASFLNLSGKQDLSFPWDVHARKLLQCTDCHFAPNNPQQPGVKAGTTAGLRGEPRREALSEYLKQPDHRLATASCRSCHDPQRGHDFLPYPERHFQMVACESCHIPRQFGPAEQMVDATLLDESGNPLVEYRGIEGGSDNLNTVYTHGFEPPLVSMSARLPEGRDPGSVALPPPRRPANLVSRWYWASGDSPEPVSRETLRQALMKNGHYRPELLTALDQDHDGKLDRNELKLDSGSKRKTVEQLLIAAGVKDPVIRSQVSARKISHGVVPKSRALSDCFACHGPGSRLEGSVLLASRAPGNVSPVWEGEASVPGQIVMGPGGKVELKPVSVESENLYVFGMASNDWPDRLGLLMLVGVVLVVILHGGYRVLSRRTAVHPAAPVPTRSLGAAAGHSPARLYIFTAYERIWHWVMALSVLALILTGFLIHFPGRLHLFGAANAVATHNFFAAVLMLNAFLALFYHLTTAAIRQFLPGSKGAARDIKLQIRYYLRDIFKGLPAPFSPSPERKLNVLQQISYLFLLNVLFPFQLVTGVMVWLVGRSPEFAAVIGGLHVVAPLHNLGAWMFISFLVAHVYLATTGHTVLAHLRCMVEGYEAVGPPAEAPAAFCGGRSKADCLRGERV